MEWLALPAYIAALALLVASFDLKNTVKVFMDARTTIAAHRVAEARADAESEASALARVRLEKTMLERGDS